MLLLSCCSCRVFESHLDLLAFLVEVDVSDVVPVERYVFRPHGVGVERLIHAVGACAPLGHLATRRLRLGPLVGSKPAYTLLRKAIRLHRGL